MRKPPHRNAKCGAHVGDNKHMDRRRSPAKPNHNHRAPQRKGREATAPASNRDSVLRYEEAGEAGPAAIVSRRASDRLREGHLWVYRSEVESLIPALGHAEIAPGALITVLDNRRIPLGSALFSSTSELTLRVVSSEPRITRGEYLELVRDRTRQALALRAPMLAAKGGETAETDSVRLLFAEADNLPGILADRYNDLIVLQLLTQGTAQDDVREVLTSELATRGVRAIVERPDARIRELEQLQPAPTAPLFSAGPDEALTTTFNLNGLGFHYDANSGQKTGAFLDLRLNYAAAARHAHGRGLDICTYQGGFALHLAQRCEAVTAVDQSRSALEVAEQNYNANREAHKLAPLDVIEADAFELLRHYDTENERFDTVVLDPPAFAKSRRAVEGALRGYKELNLRALRMLNPGGTLVTCSCSHHITLADFMEAIRSAAADAGRHVRLLETRAAAPDHPEVLTLPETRYLKCLILAVD